MMSARNGRVNDFKVSNGIPGESGFDPYRGMKMGDKIVSARDVGNYAAGFVSGVNGIPYLGMRLMFDAYQSYTKTISVNAERIEKNAFNYDYVYVLSFEGRSSRKPQQTGWVTGMLVRGIK